VAALLAAAPDGSVRAIEALPHLAAEARARFADEPRVEIVTGDMRSLEGPVDLVWCAAAIYFLGVTDALLGWKDALTSRGAVAFSEPVWRGVPSSHEARRFWEEYPPMTDEAGVRARVRDAGYATVATRLLSDAAWEAYYRPLEARIEALRPGADDALGEVLRVTRREIETWREHRNEYGYLLVVARPE